MREFLKIIGACIGAACIYGVIHDQITARICLPYFTEFHPNIGLPNDPTIVALVWGVIATWWVGLLLGVPLALVCRSGKRPALGLQDLKRPLMVLFSVMAGSAFLCGILGYAIGASVIPFELVAPRAAAWPPAMQSRFAADIFAHNASYTVGFLGGIVVIGWAWRVRRKWSS